MIKEFLNEKREFYVSWNVGENCANGQKKPVKMIHDFENGLTDFSVILLFSKFWFQKIHSKGKKPLRASLRDSNSSITAFHVDKSR